MNKKIKLTDYLAQYLKNKKIRNIYAVTGGANLHIIDSLSKIKNNKLIFSHHEQASAFAAQAASRVKNIPSVCVVTTGPGGSNSLTGLLSAWQDSIPTIFVSGQSRSQIIKDTGKRRQFGAQGFNVSDIVGKITKKFVTVYDPAKFPKLLDDCYKESLSGRPGPVWIDIPLDMQMSKISFKKINSKEEYSTKKIKNLKSILKLINASKRPVILAGNGINLSSSKFLFKKFIKQVNLPILFTWNASDLLPYNHSLNFGRPGIFGQRGSNIILQNSDLIIALGTTVSLSLTTPNYKNFAPDANIIHIDKDSYELNHFKKKIKIKENIDLKSFFNQFSLKPKPTNKKNNWKKFCLEVKRKYNKIYIANKKNYIDPYNFIEALSSKLKKGDNVVVDGGGTCNQIFFQSFKNKINQRVFISAGVCAMGSGLPDSIGISTAKNENDKVHLICGDGSFQLNIQELQTIKDNKLNIKIFIFSNRSYLSIRHTQEQFLNSNFVGSTPEGGLNVPNIKKISKAYGLKYYSFDNIKKFIKIFSKINSSLDPTIFEIKMDPNYEIKPRISFKKNPNGKIVAANIDDMYPFLKEDEITNLKIKHEI